MINHHITLLEAARLLGVSSQTVRRLIQRKRLSARQSVGPHGLRWEIERTEILRFMDGQNGVSNLDQPLSEPPQQPQQGQQKAVGVVDPSNVVDGRIEQVVGVNTIDPVDLYQAVDHGQQTPPQPQQGSVPLAAHLAALDLVGRLHQQLEEQRLRAEQAERGKLAIEWQMRQYQTALSDQAESLAEERALRLMAEAKAQEKCVDNSKALKLSSPVRSQGWGQRLRSWFLGSKTG